MFGNYLSLGGRTRSTTDMFKAPGLEDRSQPAASARNYGSTLTRAINLNRAAEQVHTSGTIFIQKLAATLERRQKEINGEFSPARYDARDERLALLKDEKKIVKGAAGAANQRNNVVDGPSVAKIRVLDDLQEHEDESEEFNDLSDSDDEFSVPQYWLSDGSIDRSNMKKKKTTDNVNDETVDPDDQPKSSFQAAIKNMLSCILNWGTTPKELPKGSREYYAARESLGEELGTFRTQTMPRLIERSKIKGGLDRSRGETSRRDLQEFSNLIGKRKSLDEEVASEPSTATIHPIHGSLKLAKKPARIPINKPVNHKEVVYGSIKVQRPAVPMERDPLVKRLPSVTPMPEPAREMGSARPSLDEFPRQSISQRLLVAAHQEPMKLSPPKYEDIKPRPCNPMFAKFYNF